MNLTLEQFEFYLCVLVRITAFIYTAPFFNLKNVPQRVKIGFSMVLAMLLFEILPYEPQVYSTVIEFGALIAKEFLAGLIMGFFANASYHILAFVGHMIDIEIGFSMVSEYDPITSTQVTITANLYTYAVMIILIITDMHHFIIKALVDSFYAIPVGGVKLNPSLYELMVTFVVDYFIIGFRIVLPMFASILVVNVVLAILAKVAPQMNMFVIGMQLKVLIGLVVLIFMIGMLPYVKNLIFDEMFDMLRSAIRYLS